MELNEKAIKFAIEKGQAKFIDNKESLQIRNDHKLTHDETLTQPMFIEVYADTVTSCGDQRVEVFGVCVVCKIQIYHWQHIVIMQMIFPLKWLDENNDLIP